jgi:radical SAM protein with 4Fe4S-binding SPASM domain
MCGQPQVDEHMEDSVVAALHQGLLQFEKPPILALAVRGEPLAHPNFAEVLQKLSQRGENGQLPFRELYIDTNAQSLDSSRITALLNVAETNKIFIRLTISVDAATEEVYQSIRRGGGFSLLLANVRQFLKERQKRNLTSPALNFQFIVMEENVEQAPLFKQLFVDLLAEFECNPLFSGKYPENSQDNISFVFHHPLIPSSENMQKSADLHHQVLDQMEITYPAQTDKNPEETCVWPFYMVVIRENGDVIPCCLDTANEMVMGNLKLTSLKNILEGKRFTEFRLQHINEPSKLPAKCRQCTDQLIVERPGGKIADFLKRCEKENNNIIR